MKPKPQKKKPKFSLARKDESMEELVRRTDKKTLAVWAVDCVERVLPCFEGKYPDDPRPRNALVACRAWIHTGEFRMADIRGASLAAHAAAREVGEDTAARSAARAAGQAVATAHVPTHSLGAAKYALQAINRTTDSSDADVAIARERDWQYHHLLALRERSDSGK
ncbi:MAG: putative immunity protein [Methanoregula sp.]